MNKVSERATDISYRNTMATVLEKGEIAPTPQGIDAITLIAPPPMRFKLSQGFPMITMRDVSSFWKQPIGEICCFVNGGRTLDDLKKFGCHFWKPWGTPQKCAKRGLETGDLGPGSYGAAFHDFPTVDGTGFDQFKNILEQLLEFPHLRTHFITPWIPQYTIRGNGKQQKVVVAPCHGWIHLRNIRGKLTLHMFQRSADLPVGVPSNMIQYAALTMMIAHVTGTVPYEYVHSFSDAHIYVDQVDAVKEMLSREPRVLPTMEMDTSVTDLFAFRKDHFVLKNYNPHPPMAGIPVAI